MIQIAQRATIAHLRPKWRCYRVHNILSSSKGGLTPELTDGCDRNSNSSKILWLSYLPISLMMIWSKIKAVFCPQHFPNYKSIWNFFGTHGQVTRNGIVWSGQKSNVRGFIPVLVTCKYRKDRIKNNQQKVETSFSPLNINGGFLWPWKPEFWSNLSQSLCSLSPTQMMQRIKCNQDWPTGFRDIQVQKCEIFVTQEQNEWSDSAQNRTRPSFYACPGYQKLWWWFNQKWTS